MANFFEDYKHPEWQKFRLAVFEHNNFTCQYCGAETRQLHAHHFFYRKCAKPWEYDVREVHCLCDSCHEHEHDSIGDFIDNGDEECPDWYTNREKILSVVSRLGISSQSAINKISAVTVIDNVSPVEVIALLCQIDPDFVGYVQRRLSDLSENAMYHFTNDTFYFRIRSNYNGLIKNDFFRNRAKGDK